MGDVEPALGEQFLHVAVAQRKAEIEPDRVLDDLGRKTMAAIAEWSHAATLTLRAALARPVSVTKPAGKLRQFPRQIRSLFRQRKLRKINVSESMLSLSLPMSLHVR
jgi:hypothetical protein